MIRDSSFESDNKRGTGLLRKASTTSRIVELCIKSIIFKDDSFAKERSTWLVQSRHDRTEAL